MKIISQRDKVRKLVYLALFTAIVFVLQVISLFMRGPVFSLTFVLVPIVIAVSLCGFNAGPWLGLIFGIAVLVTGDADAFLAYSPALTVLVVLIKGILAGTTAAGVYSLLKNRNRYLAVVLAAICAPIVNSGVFFVGCMLFFQDLVAGWAPTSQNVASYVVLGLIGINFVIEFVVNLVMVPTIYRIIEISRKH